MNNFKNSTSRSGFSILDSNQWSMISKKIFVAFEIIGRYFCAYLRYRFYTIKRAVASLGVMGQWASSRYLVIMVDVAPKSFLISKKYVDPGMGSFGWWSMTASTGVGSEERHSLARERVYQDDLFKIFDFS